SNAGQAAEEGAVLVLHGHDAVAPAVEAEVERRGEGAGEASIGVKDEDAVGVADDAMRVEEEAERNGHAVGVAAQPAQHAVVVTQLAGAALRLVDAVGAFRVDQGRKGVRSGDDDIGAVTAQRQNEKKKRRGSHATTSAGDLSGNLLTIP